tara:strand:- start:3975 stop:4577 length:603 start_codon:yes stop_codon:yes gene_type:complete
MSIAIQEEVEPIIASFAARLRAVLDRAMSDWLEMPDRGRFIYPRTRANIIFDDIVRHALIEFDGDGDEDVKALHEPQSVKFMFKNSVVARFKKGNDNGVGSNIETNAVMDFIDPQSSFGGLPEIHRVEIVYMLNVLATDYAEVEVVARDMDRRVWAFPLVGKPSAEIVPLPTRTPPVLTVPVVTPKVAPAKEDSGKDATE